MNRSIHKTFDIEIEVLSPLAINSGEKLSPLSDYFVEGEQLFFVDEEEFFKVLLENQDLSNKYETAVEKTKIDGADKFLNELFKEGGVDIQSIAKNDPILFNGGKTTELSSIIKSNGEPYIPGSSVKGAIKNAFLYYWLMNTDQGEKELSKFVIDNNQPLQRSANKISGWNNKINQIKKKEKELKKQKKKLPKIEVEQKKKLIKQIEDEQKHWDKLFSSFEQNIQNKAFDASSKKEVLKQSAGNISIKDSKPFPFKKMAAGTLMRKPLNKDSWPLCLQEYIQKNSKTSTTFSFNLSNLDWKEPNQNGEFGKILYNPSNLNALFTVLRCFNEDMKDLYNGFGLESIPVTELAKNEAMLFLGSGKGVYRNTILLAIKKEYEKQGLNFKDDFLPVIFSHSKKNTEFPASCSHINNQPLGWVKIKDKTGIYV